MLRSGITLHGMRSAVLDVDAEPSAGRVEVRLRDCEEQSKWISLQEGRGD
jgi:hypothetical protein